MFGENRLSILLWVIAAGCAAVVLVSAFAWYRLGQSSLWALLALLPLGISGWFVYRHKLRDNILRKLRYQWGRVQDRKRDFNEIQRLFIRKRDKDNDGFYIDDQTWDDLNMAQVFSAIDRTLTTPGEQVLYDMLRTPVFDGEVLKKRGRTIGIFEKDAAIREVIQMRLYMLGRQREGSTQVLLWEDVPERSKLTLLFYTMSMAALASIICIPFFGLAVTVITVLPVFGINFLINSLIKKKIMMELSSSRYLAALISTADRIGNIKKPGLEVYSEELKKLSGQCSGILKK